MPIYLGSRKAEEHVLGEPTLQEGVRKAVREDREGLARMQREAAREKRALVRTNQRVFLLKGVLDSVIDGLSSLALITLLLYTTTHSILATGLALAIRHALVLLAEEFLPLLIHSERDAQRIAYTAGVIAGFLFILTGAASLLAHPFLLALLITLFSTATAVYARASRILLPAVLVKTVHARAQRFILYYGVILASFAMILSSLAFQSTLAFSVYFTLTGVLLILAAYVTLLLTPLRAVEQSVPRDAFDKAWQSESPFMRLFLLSGSLLGSLALSYPLLLVIDAYHLFNEHASAVLVLFAAALLMSTLSPLYFDQVMLRKRGRTSIFLFGSGLVLAVPAAFLLTQTGLLVFPGVRFFPYFILFLGMAGFGIAGIALSRLMLDILRDDERSIATQALARMTAFFTPILTVVLFGLALLDMRYAHVFALLVAFLPVLFMSLLTARLEEEHFRRLHVVHHAAREAKKGGA